MANIASNNRTYLVLHVKRPIFLSDFNQIWILRTVFNKNPQYRNSRKSVQWTPCWYMRTDGRAWRSQSALFTTLRTFLQKGPRWWRWSTASLSTQFALFFALHGHKTDVTFEWYYSSASMLKHRSFRPLLFSSRECRCCHFRMNVNVTNKSCSPLYNPIITGRSAP